MAGHFAAMSEFLLRGWNVAVPFVDVGDDVLVLEDAEATIFRVQVKTADGAEALSTTSNILSPSYGRVARKEAQYQLSRAQLATAKGVELFFMFMVRWEARWRFLLVDRASLADVRAGFLATPRDGKPGRKPNSDDDAKSDGLRFDVT
jgi:hypothetical protein